MKANPMWLLSHSAIVLLLSLVVLAVCRWLRPCPAVRHALWLLVLLKLLMPPFVSWPWALPVLPAEGRQAESETSTAPPGIDTLREGEPHEPIAMPPVLFPLSDRDDISLSPMDRSIAPSGEAWPAPFAEDRDRLADAAVAVWLLGGLAVALVQLRRLARFRHGLMHASAAPSWLVVEVRELASLLKLRPPRLAVLPGLGSPLIWAGGRACLLWPEGLEKELSPQGRRAVLAHELAHLARRDHWVAWLVLVAGCLWWWHPLFYLIRRRLHREAEMACDARVVAALPDTRRAYAEALLDVCQRQSEATALTPALDVLGRRRDLERRLVMIMRENAPSRLSPRLLAGFVLLGLIVLPGWTLGQGDNPAKNKPMEWDKQVQEVERKLQGLLKDLEAQRKPAPAVASGTDRDKKLQELEAKVKALLKEVQALRANGPQENFCQLEYKPLLLGAQHFVQLNTVLDVSTPEPAEVTLSRVTYKLPAAKAEALGKFLQQHVKVPVMETKVEGDALIVTTTPEVQQGIRQFVALMEGKPQYPQWRQPAKK
jgi:beta-lactamase regulating signal transducer with metallopeptidase domain